MRCCTICCAEYNTLLYSSADPGRFVGVLWRQKDVKNEGAGGIRCVIGAQDECYASTQWLVVSMSIQSVSQHKLNYSKASACEE